MGQRQETIQEIFFPQLRDAFRAIDEDRLRFVQYTSAHAAMEIIRGKSVWLRNVQCMNDYNEIKHGISCLGSVYRLTPEGEDFRELLGSLYPGITDKLAPLFDSRIPALTEHTYITCVSEHPSHEDQYGRLSMWRAYGGDAPVALVLNGAAFALETDATASYTFPVLYQDVESFRVEFAELTERIKENSQFVRELGEESVIGLLFRVFMNFALCVKHPGFSEEREWRVVHNPVFKKSALVQPSVVSVNGIPQEVYKIPLRNIPESGLVGIEIPDIIDKVIIGPVEHKAVIGRAFIRLLKEAGCADAEAKVTFSGIPLRAE